MSPGEKLEHVIATLCLLIVMGILFATCSRVYADSHDHGDTPTATQYLKKEDDSAKYIIGTAIVMGIIYCVVEKCWDEAPKPDPRPALKITPDNLSDGVRITRGVYP